MVNPLRIAVTMMIGTLILLVLLIAGNQSLLSTLAVYIGMLSVSILVYRTNDSRLKRGLVGLSFKGDRFVRSVIWAVGLGLSFYLMTRVIPGFSIGVIRLPQSISETFRTIVIVGFAPIVETVFQVVMFAYLQTIGSKRFALVGQAVLFSLAHVGAYISGFYNYPSFTQGLSAINANLGSFVSAFIFAYVGMFILLRPKINNMAFLIIFHAILNTIILTALSVAFIV